MAKRKTQKTKTIKKRKSEIPSGILRYVVFIGIVCCAIFGALIFYTMTKDPLRESIQNERESLDKLQQKVYEKVDTRE